MIEQYDTFNTKGRTDELIFEEFNDQPIPSDYNNFPKNDNYNGNNVPGTTVDNALLDNKVVEDAAVKDNEDINYEIIIDDDKSLASYTDPLKNEILVIEGVDLETEGR